VQQGVIMSAAQFLANVKARCLKFLQHRHCNVIYVKHPTASIDHLTATKLSFSSAYFVPVSAACFLKAPASNLSYVVCTTVSAGVGVGSQVGVSCFRGINSQAV